MKKGVSLTIITVLVTLFLSSAVSRIDVDISNDINNNKYFINNDREATPYIDKMFTADGISISNVLVKQVKYSINNIDRQMKPEPDISLDGKSHFTDAPESSWELLSVGYEGSKAIVNIRFYLAGDSICTAYSVDFEYEPKNTITPKSDFDNIYNVSGDFIIVDDLAKDAVIEQASLDFIIITAEQYKDYFSDYLTQSRLFGMRTDIYTTEYIRSNFNGADVQEQIRNFIKYMYETKGIRYVLLGGDVEIIPVRYAYNDNYYYYGYVPTDMYYADLDGDWNYDNDCIIGEAAQDWIDAYPDVVVSRLPFSNEDELNVMIDKYFAYIYSNNAANLNKMLLAGASLAEELVDGTGQRFSDRLISYPNTYSCDHYKLYAPDIDTFNFTPYWLGDDQLNVANFTAKINEGYHYINHIDHSNEFWMGTGLLENNTELYVSDSLMLNTDAGTYSIMFSMGCSPNGFDRESISEMLMNSSRSPVVSYIGFTRTGWTSSQYLMEDYWQTLLDNHTMFSGDAYFAAMDDSRMYFRMAINMLGFPNMPVYKKHAGILTVVLPDSITDNEFTVYVEQDKYPKENATVVLLDGIEPVKSVTNSKGEAWFSHSFSESSVIVCVNAVSCVPLIDTIAVAYHSPVQITEIIANGSDPLAFDFTAVCYEGSFNNIPVQFSANDTVINMATFYELQHIEAGDTVTGTVYANSYRTPASDMFSRIFVCIDDLNGEEYSDSIPVAVKADTFKVIDFQICGDRYNAEYIDTVRIVCRSGVNSNAIIQIKATSLDAQVKLNSNSVDYAVGDTILLTQIALSNVNGITDLKLSEFIVEVFANQREHDIYVTAESDTVKAILQTVLCSEGVKITHNSKYPNGYLYRSENNSAFGYIGSFSADNGVFIDSSYDNANVRYYAKFYDNMDRECSITDIVSIDAFIKCSQSDVQLGASFYGKINGMKLYAKSSLNSADLNKDGLEEFVVQSDDGRVFILDNNLNDITTFSLITSKYIETSPCIGDIDLNGCYDLIFSNGMNSDTSLFIVMNPCTDADIIPVTGLGTMMSSPVVADINASAGQEILIGTTKGFYVLNSAGQVLQQYTKLYPNVVGIAVAQDKGYIAFLDYYGKLFMTDFNGSVIQGFPFLCNEVTKAPIVMTDMENDGIIEIILGTSSGKLHVVCENGVEKQGFPYIGSAAIYQSPVIADFDNDNMYEIVFCDINGRISVLDKTGNIRGQYNSQDPINTFNEPIIADVDQDGKQEIIFAGSAGNISILNGNCVPEHDIIALNTSITCTPIASESSSGQPVMIVKDLFGNLTKISFLSANSTPSGLEFPKTLYDKSNTAYVRNFTTMKDETASLKENIIINSFRVNQNITDNVIKMSYTFNNMESTPEYSLYNKAGMLVMHGMVDISTEKKSVALKESGLSSGEYFLIVSADKIYKEKILLLK